MELFSYLRTGLSQPVLQTTLAFKEMSLQAVQRAAYTEDL